MPASTHDQLVLFAVLTLAAPLAALLLALFSFVFKKASRLQMNALILGWATRLLSAVSLVFSILLAWKGVQQPPLAFPVGPIGFYLDALSLYFVLLVNLVAFFASWYTVDYLIYDAGHSRLYREGNYHEPEFFHIFFNAFHLTMLIVPMVDNLIILWMAIELTTLASTLLVRYRRRRRTVEAAWKYIIITTAGIVFALFGTIFLADAVQDGACQVIAEYQAATTVNTCEQLEQMRGPTFDPDLIGWSLLGQRGIAEELNRELVILSFLFVLVGYGTKAGLAPMHTWLPDGHGEAPSPVSALLSGVLLKSALYAILRFYTITNLALGGERLTSAILLFAGLFSLVLATPFILKENKFKRILAYHSLEHMGIITFGIAIGGTVALFGALLHALNHALTKALMFLAFGNVRREYISCADVAEPDEDQFTGIFKSMPLSGVVLTFGGLGLVGAPPFNIFFSEFIIVWAALGRIRALPGADVPLPAWAYTLAVILFLLTVTLIFGGLVGHLAKLLLDRPPFDEIQEDLAQVIPLLFLLAIVTLFGVWIPTWPADLPGLLRESVCILQQGAGASCLP